MSACISRRKHCRHDVELEDGSIEECPGYTPGEVDPVAEVTSGRALGRLFERQQEES